MKAFKSTLSLSSGKAQEYNEDTEDRTSQRKSHEAGSNKFLRENVKMIICFKRDQAGIEVQILYQNGFLW